MQLCATLGTGLDPCEVRCNYAQELAHSLDSVTGSTLGRDRPSGQGTLTYRQGVGIGNLMPLR